jgi:prepilin-type processing-associated H-X9-DG protein
MTGQWRPYNSRNHAGQGQNVLFLDAHVEFVKTPLVGIHNDNIYTLQNSRTNAREIMIGVVPDPEQTWGPLTNTDSFIVP